MPGCVTPLTLSTFARAIDICTRVSIALIIFMPLKELWKAYSNQSVPLSLFSLYPLQISYIDTQLTRSIQSMFQYDSTSRCQYKLVLGEITKGLGDVVMCDGGHVKDLGFFFALGSVFCIDKSKEIYSTTKETHHSLFRTIMVK